MATWRASTYERAARRVYQRYEMLGQAEQGLRQVYGAQGWARIKKARAQPRDAKGRFSRWWRDAQGRFAKAPPSEEEREQRWAEIPLYANTHYVPGMTPAPVRTWRAPTQAQYTYTAPVVEHDYGWDQPTYTTTTIAQSQIDWRPIEYTITTGGDLAATHPGVWQQWYEPDAMRTYVTTGTGTGYYITDEAMVRAHNQPVYDRWTVQHRLTEEEALRIEEMERLRAEAEERRALEVQRRREEYNRQALLRAQKTEGAAERALQLLEMILTPEERELRARTGIIHVRGSEGGLYEIDTRRPSVHGNIQQVDEHGCVLAAICVAPHMYDEDPEVGRIGLPIADGWVGQYLTLKHNEGEIKDKGNWYSQRPCQHPGVPVLGAVA